MNTPVEYSWTFIGHLTLLTIKCYLRNYITMELEGSPMNGLYKSYLNNRTQKTKVNGSISEKTDITYGVPQGSIF